MLMLYVMQYKAYQTGNVLSLARISKSLAHPHAPSPPRLRTPHDLLSEGSVIRPILGQLRRRY